ncbi:MAG: hypothetical protein M3548_15850 [Actinomycetota bacterium]|nr:hypothetical protein [Actinomycetota bacterium]
MTHWRGEREPDHSDTDETAYSAAAEQRQAKLPAILSIIAIIVIVGTVITIVLINRDVAGGKAVPRVSSTASPSAPPSTRVSATSVTRPPTDRRVVENRSARLSYSVSAEWTEQPSAKFEVLNVAFTGVATYGNYRCDGKEHTRGTAASAAVQNTQDKELDPQRTAEAFAKAFTDRAYPGAQTDAPTTRASEIAGKKAVLVIAKVRPKASGCTAGAAMVAVLAVDLDNATATTPRGLALLVITNDLDGGPATPEPLPENTIQAIMAGTRVN